MMLGTNREVFRLGPGDFPAPPRAMAHFDLPTPFAPRALTFRRAAAERLRRATLREPAPERGDEADDALSGHPVAGCPQLSLHLRAAAAADRLRKDVDRLGRRVRGRSESLARQFDRVLRVLEAWGYVEGWTLTDAGGLLRQIFAESDLLIAEALRDGLLDGTTPAELAALVSCFTYERRGPDAQRSRPVPVWPSSRVAQRARDLDRLGRDLRANEDDAGLPETRPPDPGLTDAIHAWASGESLADVLDEDDELTGGDFVRHVKQVIDLLRQLALAAPEPATRDCARAAAEDCHRGVVAASGLDVPA